MARDAALGRKNPWQHLFSPDRKKVVGGAVDYFKENLDYPRYLLSGWLGEGHDHSLQRIKPNEGRVLTVHGRRAACYRDEHGELSIVSAVCTHMGCIVRFNQAEKTWDCPCHGSRFSTRGEVIGGPAEEPLQEVKDRRRQQTG
jgi:Rieske Fe-S protein